MQSGKIRKEQHTPVPATQQLCASSGLVCTGPTLSLSPALLCISKVLNLEHCVFQAFLATGFCLDLANGITGGGLEGKTRGKKIAITFLSLSCLISKMKIIQNIKYIKSLHYK